MKKLLITVLALFPLIAIAEYDAERIKNEISEDETFLVDGWSENDSGNGWVAEHKLGEEVINLSVNDKHTGMMTIVSDEITATMTMLRCSMLGYIGLDEYENNDISEVAILAFEKGEKQSLLINNSEYYVYPIQTGNVVTVSCGVEPIQ